MSSIDVTNKIKELSYYRELENQMMDIVCDCDFHSDLNPFNIILDTISILHYQEEIKFYVMENKVDNWRLSNIDIVSFSYKSGNKLKFRIYKEKNKNVKLIMKFNKFDVIMPEKLSNFLEEYNINDFKIEIFKKKNVFLVFKKFKLDNTWKCTKVLLEG